MGRLVTHTGLERHILTHARLALIRQQLPGAATIQSSSVLQRPACCAPGSRTWASPRRCSGRFPKAAIPASPYAGTLRLLSHTLMARGSKRKRPATLRYGMRPARQRRQVGFRPKAEHNPGRWVLDRECDVFDPHATSALARGRPHRRRVLSGRHGLQAS
jgi:hypothetical protein